MHHPHLPKTTILIPPTCYIEKLIFDNYYTGKYCSHLYVYSTSSLWIFSFPGVITGIVFSNTCLFTHLQKYYVFLDLQLPSFIEIPQPTLYVLEKVENQLFIELMPTSIIGMKISCFCFSLFITSKPNNRIFHLY